VNEQETRTNLILPKIQKAGWGKIQDSRIREEFPIAQGRLIGNGCRDKPLKADYVLQYKNRNLAIIEAKDHQKYYTEGVAQAKSYAEKLQIRFAYSTNGLKIYAIDRQTGKEGDISGFPSPDELWQMTFAEKNEWRDKLLSIPFEDRGGTWQPRYYQENAITKVLESIADKKHRILLTLATGTGKTAIAFQIAWKLFNSRWNLNRDGQRIPRILFLADRNILADQAFNAFNAFEEDALVRISPDEIRKKKRVPKNGSVFFTIFQTFMSGPNGEPYFGEYPKNFFDIIIIDECHRGGANDESTWRAILDYFSPAVQLGLTATPKRDINGDTYAYFGEPVYVYSLKAGINEGFLTPFRVKEIKTTIDDYVYTSDDEIIEGEIEEGKRYVESDFNRILEIEAREKYRVKLFMKDIVQNQKTLVFCANQNHALFIRDLINQIADSEDSNYCHRVTADDGKSGEQYLRDFQDNEKKIPTILTTSQKLSTGVDALEIRNIVLLRPINSMIEFKQIIGRGTRLFDGKDYFTIYDFVNAHLKFKDDEWDGPPKAVIQIKSYHEDSKSEISENKLEENVLPYGVEQESLKQIIKIKLADGKMRELDSMVKTTFWSPEGKPISSEEFLHSMFGTLPEFFKNEDELRHIWSRPDTREKLLESLNEKGFSKTQLHDVQKLIHAEKSDLYDVLAYVAFKAQPIDRSTRASRAKIYFHDYDEKQQIFLNFVLEKYVKSGVEELAESKLRHLLELKYHTIEDAKQALGNITTIRNTFVEFQGYLYTKAA